MGQNKKPNFQPYGNKKSGGKKPQRDVIAGTSGTSAKRQTPKTHHDGLKGNRGNGGGKRR